MQIRHAGACQAGVTVPKAYDKSVTGYALRYPVAVHVQHWVCTPPNDNCSQRPMTIQCGDNTDLACCSTDAPQFVTLCETPKLF